MCGIAGVFSPDGTIGADNLAAIATAMAATLQHRGPDDAGVWVDEANRVAFGHRRLAIIDRTPSGHQPLTSVDGRITVCFNGEIYNHAELRDRLAREGRRVDARSDTRVLAEAIAAWGLDGTLDRLDGMFALAVWDAAARQIHLVRDRLGEKPLHYAQIGRTLLFASELKALRCVAPVDATLDAAALGSYMRFGYVPAPATIYRGVRKLPAATVLTASAERIDGLRQYWSLRAIGSEPVAHAPEAAQVDEMDGLLRAAVQGRLEADVPIGVFLSGGLDSTAVAAMAQAVSSSPVATFTIGFAERSHDERDDAARIAAHLGTDHRELLVGPDDALGAVDELPSLYDEPFADPSALPTLLMSRLAREHVTVALSGDGGDEVFGGYNRTVAGSALWRRLRHLPRPVRLAARRALLAPSHRQIDRVLGVGGGRGGLPRNPADKVQRLANLLAATGDAAVPEALVSIWTSPTDVLLDGQELTTAWRDQSQWLPHRPLLDQMLYLDAVTTLPDQMLVKVDRASMACGLEVRPPLLAPAIVERAWRLATELKVRPGASKWILREVVDRYVPASLLDRPKTGFDPPLGAWLRGPLRDWAAERLSPTELRSSGVLRQDVIARRWREHLDGRHNWDYPLWTVLMFQEWSRREQALVSVTAATGSTA